MNKKIEENSKLKLVHTIKVQYHYYITSVCKLKDRRIVASSHFGKSITVYNHSYQLQIDIENAHDDGVVSICVLRNGELASSSFDTKIKIWIINENDYKLIYTLKGHTSSVWKIIELKDGKLCSSSKDATVKIWDNNTFQCTATLAGHIESENSIIEMNNFIISASPSASPPFKNEIKKWDKTTYECDIITKSIPRFSNNLFSKLNDNTFIVGGFNVLLLADIQTHKINAFKNKLLGDVGCLTVYENRLAIIGNKEGEIVCCNPFSNQIIFKQKFHKYSIFCLAKTEDNEILSSSTDITINIYNYFD